MAQFQPFNYGQAINQGTTNALNTINIRNAQAREGRQQTNFLNQQEKFSGDQQLENTKLMFSAFTEMSQRPESADRLVPLMKQRGLIKPDFDHTTMSLEEIQSTSTERAQALGAGLQAYGGGQSQKRPSSVQEYNFFQTLSPDDRKVFMQIKRANPTVKVIDQGDRSTVIDSNTSQVIAEFKKELTPAQQPENIRNIEAAKLEGKDVAKKGIGKTKAEMKTSSGQAKNVMLNDLIDQAKGQAGFWTTGLIGQAASGIGGTQAHDLANTMNTIKSNIGFDKLQEMRDSSPTGGALGQVSEKENILLQSTWGALEQSQSEKQFKVNLERVRKQVKASWARIAKAYEKDYGEPFQGFDAGEQELSIEDLVNQYAQ